MIEKSVCYGVPLNADKILWKIVTKEINEIHKNIGAGIRHTTCYPNSFSAPDELLYFSYLVCGKWTEDVQLKILDDSEVLEIALAERLSNIGVPFDTIHFRRFKTLSAVHQYEVLILTNMFREEYEQKLILGDNRGLFK